LSSWELSIHRCAHIPFNAINANQTLRKLQSWLTLCPGGHLILAYNAANIPLHVRLHSSLFDGLWCPMSGLDLDNRIDTTEIYPSISLELPNTTTSGESNRGDITMDLLESPMHADTWKSWNLWSFRRQAHHSGGNSHASSRCSGVPMRQDLLDLPCAQYRE
jgi:hypothetical protein